MIHSFFCFFFLCSLILFFTLFLTTPPHPIATPRSADAPLKPCKSYPTDLFLESNWIRMGRTMGCAYALGMSPGSVAANYNWNTKTAAQPVLLGPVTCDNCFAVMGTGVLAALNYASVPGQLSFSSFYAEIKMVGAAGASLSLKGTAGQWSQSKTMNLQNFIPGVPPNGKLTVRIGGAGLQLVFQFAGATATMRGSGTSAGSFSVAYGRLGSVNLGGIYQMGKGFSVLRDLNWQNLDKPFVNNGFTVTNWQASVELKAGMNIAITFASIVTGNFNIFVGGVASISSPAGTTGKLTAAKLSSSATRRRLAGGVMTVQPGDVLNIAHAFDGFNPNEAHTMYYSLKSVATGQEYPILTQGFSTGEDGAGTVNARYTVPWNLNLAAAGQSARLSGSLGSIKDLLNGGDETLVHHETSATDAALGPDAGKLVLVARTSAYMEVASAVTTSEPLVIDMFSGSDSDGIFSFPAAGATTHAAKPVQVSWNAALLHEFKAGPLTYMGEDVNTAKVGVELVAETLADDGSVLFSQRHYVARGLANTGSATLTLDPFAAPFSVSPSAAAKSRYYLVVSSEGNYQVQGWSKGYFSIDAAGYQAPAASSSASSSPSERARGSITMLPASRPVVLDKQVLRAAQLYAQASSSSLVALAPAAETKAESVVSLRGLQAKSKSAPAAAGGSLSLPVTVSIYMGAGLTTVDLVVFGSITINKQFQVTLWTQQYKLAIAGTAAPPGTPCSSLEALARRLDSQIAAVESEALADASATASVSATFRQLQRAVRGAAARSAKAGVAAAGAVCAWKPKPKPKAAPKTPPKVAPKTSPKAKVAPKTGPAANCASLKGRAARACLAKAKLASKAKPVPKTGTATKPVPKTGTPPKTSPKATANCASLKGRAARACLAKAKLASKAKPVPKTGTATKPVPKTGTATKPVPKTGTATKPVPKTATKTGTAAAKPKPTPLRTTSCARLRGPALAACQRAARGSKPAPASVPKCNVDCSRVSARARRSCLANTKPNLPKC